MNDLITELLTTFAAIVAPVLATLVAAWLVQLTRKLGIELDAEKQAKLEHTATQAILRAEEWGAARVKAGFTKATGAQKLERAAQDLLMKVPGITEQEARALVHAKLPEVGVGAASFLRAVRQAATDPVAR